MDIISILENNRLFKGVSRRDIEEIINSIPTAQKSYRPKDIIMRQGEIARDIGIILSGGALGIKYTPSGDEIIASRMGPGHIFADVLSAADGFASPVTVTATERCRVLFINYHQLLNSENPLTLKVLQNMIQNISLKYFAQNRRMDILTQRTVRDKALAYLEWQREIQASDSFEIPLNRRLMSDYLAVDRAALSRELSKMKSEGLIDYRKNRFTLLKK